MTAKSNTPMDATPFLPRPGASLPQLARAAEKCRGCDLYKTATHAVFGEGAPTPRRGLFFIVEQPGDKEDQTGRPFIGPAGTMLNKALVDAGIDRSQVFITNAVKHFRWTPSPRGPRRIHKRPTVGQMHACGPWLQRELALVKPKIIVCLGATAGQAVLGPTFRVSLARGKPITGNLAAPFIVATIHPAAILRVQSRVDRQREYRAFVEDLSLAAALLSRPS